jgi:hypothetical protein
MDRFPRVHRLHLLVRRLSPEVLKSSRGIVVHRPNGKFLVVQTLERGKKAADPMLVVMTHDSPVLKLEDASNADLVFKAIIPRDVPRVAVEIKVADVEESAGPKHALALGQQSHLIVVIWYAREDREEDDGVNAAYRFAHDEPRTLPKFEMRILSACSGNHSRGRIEPQKIGIARAMKLG